jgi:hypothetical protein
VSAQVDSAATGPKTKPSKASTFFIALAFCLAGAVGGGVIGFFAGVKGAGFATAGIAAGGAAGYEYLRRKGAFPSKKSQG